MAPVVADAAVDGLFRREIDGVLIFGSGMLNASTIVRERDVELDHFQVAPGAMPGGEKAVAGIADDPGGASDG